MPHWHVELDSGATNGGLETLKLKSTQEQGKRQKQPRAKRRQGRIRSGIGGIGIGMSISGIRSARLHGWGGKTGGETGWD